MKLELLVVSVIVLVDLIVPSVRAFQEHEKVIYAEDSKLLPVATIDLSEVEQLKLANMQQRVRILQLELDTAQKIDGPNLIQSFYDAHKLDPAEWRFEPPVFRRIQP